MQLISRYTEGSDLTILNISYHYPRKDEDSGKYSKDFADILFKDNKSGKKYLETIYEPTYVFYKANDGLQIDYNMFYIDKSKVHEVECKYKDLDLTIAKLTGNEEFFYENCKTGNRKANKLLHTIPTIFSSDVNIEDHLRARFARDYKNDVCPIKKGYFDIEVNSENIDRDFPELGECPVNAVSFIDDGSNTLNIFLLRDDTNPLVEEFENELKTDPDKLYGELRDFITEAVSGEENAKKYHVDSLIYNFAFYDDERNLIIDLFRTINMYSPDFILAWNIAFDFPYLYHRCIALGLDPSIVMSSSDAEEKYADYYIDLRHKNVYELRGDYYTVASKTIYIDQLVQFASRRKGQAAFPDFKLDTAANIITKGAVRKTNYSDITTNLIKLPRLNYKRFVFYNVVDTINQKAIEESVKDIDYIFTTCIQSDTRYSKGHRQTVFLTNQARKFFYDHGYILGNNCNATKEDTEDVSFAGAHVGDPTHNSDYSKVKIGGQVFNLSDNCDDYDFKSLYPSIYREHNLAPNNIIGKIIVSDKVHRLENPYHSDMYDRGGQFIEDLCTCNYIEFCKRWYNYAGIRELLEDVEEYFSTMQLPSRPVILYTDNNMIKPFNIYPDMKNNNDIIESKMVKPFTINKAASIDIESLVRDIGLK